MSDVVLVVPLKGHNINLGGNEMINGLRKKKKQNSATFFWMII